ncbi:hypothetical protein CLF_110656 [Clonorchis sinensis]|uniref:Uncharacterized protein n=1 Tax=Clonorchis sinensis TaxID=79923 RepID=G7YL04_CLOSI|nr:hypothetical protein CLF_110656 [Clonorchis sinensis]
MSDRTNQENVSAGYTRSRSELCERCFGLEPLIANKMIRECSSGPSVQNNSTSSSSPSIGSSVHKSRSNTPSVPNCHTTRKNPRNWDTHAGEVEMPRLMQFRLMSYFTDDIYNTDDKTKTKDPVKARRLVESTLTSQMFVLVSDDGYRLVNICMYKHADVYCSKIGLLNILELKSIANNQNITRSLGKKQHWALNTGSDLK